MFPQVTNISLKSRSHLSGDISLIWRNSLEKQFFWSAIRDEAWKACLKVNYTPDSIRNWKSALGSRSRDRGHYCHERAQHVSSVSPEDENPRLSTCDSATRKGPSDAGQPMAIDTRSVAAEGAATRTLVASKRWDPCRLAGGVALSS